MIVPYARAAGTVARIAARGAASRRWAMNNPGMLTRAGFKAGRTILRAWRGYKRRKRVKARFSPRMVGMPNSASTSKTSYINNETQIARDTRTLYALDVTQLGQGSQINQRLRQHAKVTGFKICMEVRNTEDVPMYFNMCVIAPKNTQSAGGPGNRPSEINFFRNNTDARSMNFSISRTGLELHCCPINSDDYTILRHKRYIINTANPTNYKKEYGTSFLNIEEWVSLRRQARYQPGESSDATDGRVFHCFWFDKWGAAADELPSQAALQSSRIITYFREPRN